ncbi:MAG TPA: NADH-ubiquinone oxidoreductase-F iron-sulfur binding region domain-containing protein [Nakamurella sp.]
MTIGHRSRRITAIDPHRAPLGTDRLLPASPAVTLSAHESRIGPLPEPAPGALISMVEAAGLRGRGGAGFPTARKLVAVAHQARHGRRAVVVANCCDGDPTSAKDDVLVSRSPHLVIDGALLAAASVHADRVILAVHRGSPSGDDLRTALAERPSAVADVEVRDVPPRFVASEASALVNYLTGGDARPRGRLRPIWEKGVDQRPTLVDNAETLAQLALIGRFGPDWFSSIGQPAEPGTALVTIGGAVPRDGVLEIAYGTPVRAILRAAGADATGWALVGGLAGRWTELARVAEIGYSSADLVSAGAVRGVGSITVLPPDGCLLNETVGILHYLADAGAGQCGPCMFGLPAIAADMAALARGDRAAVNRLRRRLPVIDKRGACGHPDGAVMVAASALGILTGPQSAHLATHLRGRGCRMAPPTVPLGPRLTVSRT